MKNADGYLNDYAPKVRALIKEHGGRILAAGQNVVVLEGEPPKSRVVIQQWEASTSTRSTARPKRSQKCASSAISTPRSAPT